MSDTCAHGIPCELECIDCYRAVADEVARLTAENKRLVAEVAWLRAHRAWSDGMRDARRCCISWDAWVASHPEPSPPEGVEP